MKLDALDHPKTHALTALLNISRPTAIGHLELLWAFTGKNAPQGNIGKWPDGAIARACDWTGTPELFINALVEARFLDRDDVSRVSVHDWHEHAPGWVRAKLTGLKQEFARLTPGQSPPAPAEKPPEPTGSPPGSPPGTAPSILVKGSEEKGSRNGADAPPPLVLGEPPPAFKPKRASKISLPDDFLLTEDLDQYARERLPGVDVPALFESFCGKARAKDWKYANWKQAWQEFVRNCAPSSGHWASGQYPKQEQGKWM